MLRKLVVGLALAAAVALPLADTAEAAIADGVAASHIASRLLPVENAQFAWGAGSTAGMAMAGAARDFIGAATPGTPAWAGAAAMAGTVGAAAPVGRAAFGAAAVGTVAVGTAAAAVGTAAAGLAWRWRRLARRRRRLARRRRRLARRRRRLSRRRWRLSWRRWSHAPLNRPDQVLARYSERIPFCGRRAPRRPICVTF